jgi:hypothetical protein
VSIYRKRAKRCDRIPVPVPQDLLPPSYIERQRNRQELHRLNLGDIPYSCRAVTTMVGFVPIQGQARLFERVPSIPADSACFAHANFLSGEYEVSHLVHACGVPARSVRVLAEQAGTFLADCWLIASHPTSTKL